MSALPAWQQLYTQVPSLPLSAFAQKLQPQRRILELPGYFVWCNAPIVAPDGKIHVFFSRWKDTYGMGGWIHKSEIAHAIAEHPTGPYEVTETVLAPRGTGHWDATTCHNPHIQYVDGQYCLFYMGNANGKTDTKRIGLATAPGLNGPWTRYEQPLLEAGKAGTWDDHCTTNPSFIKKGKNDYWLYYKSWNTADYTQAKGSIRGNRKYGLATASSLLGPYERYEGNPILDFSGMGQNQQLEDAFIYRSGRKFHLIARDMGYFNHEVGLWMDSTNGKKWDAPQVAYLPASNYIQEPPPPAHLKRYGRFERPQLLLEHGKPTYLFAAMQGGKYATSSGFVFKIEA